MIKNEKNMDNCMYSVFVPSYPMLLTDTWEGYKVQLEETLISDEKPETGDYYLKDGEYHIHPDAWDESYIGTFSALTNLLIYGDLSEEERNLAENNLKDLQEEFVKRFRVLSEEIRGMGSVEAREEMMTKADMEMAEQAHDLVLASGADERSRKMVSNLANMFAAMDYDVLYEGVEKDTDEEMCRRMSAAYLQGFKYSRPVPITEMKDYLEAAG